MTGSRYAVEAMSAYELRGLVTEDGEIDYSQHWQYGFDHISGVFLAALFDDVVDGEWWEGTWYPFHDPKVPIEAYAADAVEELEEIITGGSIPDELLDALREEQRQHHLQAARRSEVEAER